MPAFVVFSDATLRGLAAAKPTAATAMLKVSGVGPAKLDRYGEEFLAVIRKFMDEIPSSLERSESKQPDDTDGLFVETTRLDEIRREHLKAYEPWTADEERQLERLHSSGLDIPEIAARLGRRPGAIRPRLSRLGRVDTPQPLGATHALTQQLLQQGFTITEIARERGLSEGTVLSHIERIADTGETVDLRRLLPSGERLESIRAAFQQVGEEKLAPVKALLGDEYSYGEIRLARLFWWQQQKQ